MPIESSLGQASAGGAPGLVPAGGAADVTEFRRSTCSARSSSSLVRIGLLNVAFLILLLAALEGVASLSLFAWTVVSTLRDHANWDSAVYDADLGWVNAPNLYRPDVYGRGLYVRTNRQGFRDNHDFPKAVAPGKRRIICSGDSFTFGYGVDNESTWCRVLESMDARLETVNMGQGGYGLDQVYLRYRRDGAGLDHHLQVVAFITEDFTRMQLDSFHGYGKPKLELSGGQLVVGNTPVPRRSFYARWLTSTLQHLQMLRTAEVLARIGQRLPARWSREPASRATGENARQLASRVFRELDDITRDRSAKLVLVYLPTPDDYSRTDALRAWETFVEGVAVDLGVPLINVIAEHRQLSPERVARLFGPNRHYSIEGNAYVANVIHRKLTSLPDVLGPASPPR
jgi:hypothetical protein